MAQFCLLSNICLKLGGGQEGSRELQAAPVPREAWAGGRHPASVKSVSGGRTRHPSPPYRMEQNGVNDELLKVQEEC